MEDSAIVSASSHESPSTARLRSYVAGSFIEDGKSWKYHGLLKKMFSCTLSGEEHLLAIIRWSPSKRNRRDGMAWYDGDLSSVFEEWAVDSVEVIHSPVGILEQRRMRRKIMNGRIASTVEKRLHVIEQERELLLQNHNLDPRD